MAALHNQDPDPEQEIPPLPPGLRMTLYYLVIFTLISLGGSLFLRLLLSREVLESGGPIDFTTTLLVQVLLTPMVVAATRIFAQQVDGKPLAELGAQWPVESDATPWDGTLGPLGLAGLLVVIWLVMMEALGTLNWSSMEGGAAGILRGGLFAIGFLIAGLMQELIFRGYIYTTLRERLAWIHAGGITSLLVVVQLLADPERPALMVANIFFLGLLLAVFREISGSIWPGAVFSAAWNFVTFYVLALPMEGERVAGLFPLQTEGAEALTGGEYGPEGSWLLMVPLVVLLLWLTAWMDRKGLGAPLIPPPEEDEDAF